MNSQLSVLISDLDNTLYDFAEYFSPSFRAMIHALSRETGVVESQLVRDFAEVYRRHGTIEYTYSVQNLASLSSLNANEIDRLVHIAHVAFGRTRRRRLRLYPGVKDTLRDLVAGGVLICIVTNAPWYSAYRRLHDLGILSFVHSLSAWNGFQVPSSEFEKYASALEHVSTRSRVSRYSSDERKPQPHALLNLVNWLGDDRNMFVIGDSIANDLAPASALGMTTIWAKYGNAIDDHNRQTMLEVTPAAIATAELPSDFVPDFSIDQFSSVLQILGLPTQPRLF